MQGKEKPFQTAKEKASEKTAIEIELNGGPVKYVQKLKKLLFIAASWMGTDDPDWDEVAMVNKEVKALGEEK